MGMTTFAGIILLAGRVLLVALFAFSARGHIRDHARYLETARGKVPIALLAGWPTGAFLTLASISVVLGIWLDIGALMLLAFLIPTTLLFHRFWTFSEPNIRRTQASSFYRNVSLAGAALILFAFAVSGGRLPFTITGPAISLR